MAKTPLIAPGDKRATGVDEARVARLWDLGTGRVLYEAKVPER
jgi:hypothetical protein